MHLFCLPYLNLSFFERIVYVKLKKHPWAFDLKPNDEKGSGPQFALPYEGGGAGLILRSPAPFPQKKDGITASNSRLLFHLS